MAANDVDGAPTTGIRPATVENPAQSRADDISEPSDEDVESILRNHAKDPKALEVEPILTIVKDIFSLATRSFSDAFRGFGIISDCSTFAISDEVGNAINNISMEMIRTCREDNTHSATLTLIRSLTDYSWDAKIVITLAALAITFGEFGLSEEFHHKNAYAKTIVILKDLPEAPAKADELKAKLEETLNLVKSALLMTHCIMNLTEYMNLTSQESRTPIANAVYWTIRSLLTCTAAVVSLNGTGHRFTDKSTLEAWERIVNLSPKLSVKMEEYRKTLEGQWDGIETNEGKDIYLGLKRLIASAHKDNMKVLRAMFSVREDQRLLYNGTTKTNILRIHLLPLALEAAKMLTDKNIQIGSHALSTASSTNTRQQCLEVLRNKYVLLLISDLEHPHEELTVLDLIYNQDGNKRREYEVLWLPILNPASPMNPMQEKSFYDLRNSMPWFSVDHPSVVKPVAIKYIRKQWKFTHMPMLVVLDHHGKLVNLDALPMMWIWGSAAFPFTKETERSLWETSQWNISLLAGSIDTRIPDWIADNKVICLYGGEDIDWIRKFTHATREVSRALGVPIEMLYVGKRNPKEKVRRCNEIIDREKLSHVFSVKDYYDFVWYFWVRLCSMWYSKKQIGRTVDDDRIMEEIMDVLTFDSSEKGWAVFSRANFDITKGNADRVLPVMENVANWGYLVDHPDKFVQVLDEQLRGFRPEHHCNRLILPGLAEHIHEGVVCSDCGKIMEKIIMYHCCTD